MSKTIHIGSVSQFDGLLAASKFIVADFYADWCGPCKAIAPHFEKLSAQHSRTNMATFVKIDVDKQGEIAKRYQVTAMPTFLLFKDKQVVETIRGANPQALTTLMKHLTRSDAAGETDTNGGSSWTAFPTPKGYGDVTDEIEVNGLDLLNADGGFGTVRDLFRTNKPSFLSSSGNEKGKGKSSEDEKKKDWVESDTDEQLMLFVPFMSTMKVHSLHITAASQTVQDADEAPMRPKTIRVYANRANILGFDEAEDVEPTQEIVLREQDWDQKTSTAKLELRFVKFQNVKSMVLFIVEGDGDGEKVRIDRIRFLGETGEKREQGKLTKLDDQ